MRIQNTVPDDSQIPNNFIVILFVLCFSIALYSLYKHHRRPHPCDDIIKDVGVHSMNREAYQRCKWEHR